MYLCYYSCMKIKVRNKFLKTPRIKVFWTLVILVLGWTSTYRSYDTNYTSWYRYMYIYILCVPILYETSIYQSYHLVWIYTLNPTIDLLFIAKITQTISCETKTREVIHLGTTMIKGLIGSSNPNILLSPTDLI